MRLLFSKEKIKEILKKSDLVKIIGSKIPISRVGANYKANCPFHEEKTPSFSINTARQFYYCFGCGAYGNCINFLMKYNNSSFVESITYLAKKTNLEVFIPFAENQESQGYIYSTMNRCLELYKSNLNNNQEIKLHLKARGIEDSSIKKFDIGYSDNVWNGLNKEFDRKMEFSLIKTGMQVKKGDRVYDRFRNRIMFPIKNKYGNTVGFGGRSIDGSQPKYINSPETKIFHKSNELYGLYELGTSKSLLKRLLVVEGYTDVVILYQYGIQAVAVLGTTINIKQIKNCLGYTKDLVFCFDGDTPGRRAAWKTMKVVLSILDAGIQIRFLFLPEGNDPDSLIRKIGKDRFEEYIDNASVFTEIFFDIIKKKFSFSSLESKIRYANTVMQYINRIPKGFAQEIMKKELADKLCLTKNSVSIACLANSNYVTKKSDKSDENTCFSERLIYLLLEKSKLVRKLYGWRFLLFTDINNIQIISSLMFCFPNEVNIQNLMLSTITKLEKKSLIKTREKIRLTNLEVTNSEFVYLFKKIKICYSRQKVAELMLKSGKNLISPDEFIVLQMVLKKI